MTSEVVVMNRLGVALASDSAATVFSGGRAKVFHADKLFMLSQKQPVGVMIYNNSSLLGVPWETILKMFRRDLGDTELDHLEQYADRLIKYLDRHASFFPPDVQKRYYVDLVRTLFEGISKGIRSAVIESVTDSEEDGPDGPKGVAKNIILKSLEDWKQKPDVKCFDPGIGKELADKYSAEIHALVEKYFVVWQIDAEAQSALRDLTIFLVSKDEILPESLSGVVIAGYGAEEHFPVMQAFELGEIFLGKLKYRRSPAQKINTDNPSIVQPFAEHEMVETFLNGISPAFERKLISEIARVVLELPDAVIDAAGISKKRKTELKGKVRPKSIDLIKALAERIDAHVMRHKQPVQQAISFLPKNELAHFAASLVNLNSFQKRMSINEDETVAGPIDVAVISKGDGFVWIARKHYFPRELNYHFFRNYGGRGGATHEEENQAAKE